MSIEHLSPSTVQTYRKCGKQVYFDKIIGLKNPQQYATTVYGTAMHFAIEQLYKQKLDKTAFVTAFITKFQEKANEVTIWKTDTEGSLIEEGSIALSQFFDEVYGKYPVMLTEQELNIDRGSGNFPILCYADAITEDGSIIDYKFGRGLTGVADSRAYACNMATYAWGYKQKYGSYPKKIIFIKEKWGYKKDPKTGEKVYHHSGFVIEEHDVYEATVEFYKDVYDNVEVGIQAGVFLPAEDGSFFCKSCGYRIAGYCTRDI
jgi:hypothetical protein